MMQPTEKDRFSSKFSDSAKDILNSAFASTSPLDALKQLTKLLDGEVILRCEATEFSSSTGKPIRFAWKPCRKWDGILWIDCLFNSPLLDKDEPLYKPLMKFLSPGKTIIIEDDNKKFVVRRVPARSEGDLRTGGTIPAHIEFTEAT